MKRVLASLALVVTVFAVSARQLSPTEALDRAIGDNRTSRAVVAASDQKLVYTASDSLVRPMAYVFTSGENRGYMVVSADDVAVPVLAYSDSGTFDAGSMPDNMRWWLDEYAREIAWAADRADVADSRANGESTGWNRPYRAPVAPKIKTHWNQGAPFNNLCPVYSGYRCMTGCVATAMAQVMNYHQWPKQGTGSHTYTTATHGLNVGWNFEMTTFDWDNMLDDYVFDESAEAEHAVATLMAAVGVAVDMNYTPNASGALSSAVAPAMRDYFSYDDAITYRRRDWYGLMEWEDMIYDEIVNVGPVYYDGANSGSGHAFVCDGYSSDGYFHFNWGWGGISDGYFRLTALDPASQGIGGSTSGYNWSQGILTGAQPPQPGSKPTYIFGRAADELGCSESEPALGREVAITGGFYNLSGRDIPESVSVTFGIAIKRYGTDDTVYAESTDVVDYTEGFLANAGFRYFNVILPASLTAGLYEIEPVYAIDGGGWQRMINYKSFLNSTLYMDVNGGRASFTTVSPGFRITGITASDMYHSSRFRITGTFSNTGDKEFHSGLCGVFVPVGTDPTEIFYVGEGVGRVMMVDYMPNESGTIEYVSDVCIFGEYFAPGDYDFIMIDYNAYRYNIYKPYSDPVRVTIKPQLDETAQLSLDSWGIVDAGEVNPSDMRIDMTVTGVAGVYYAAMTFGIYTVVDNYAADFVARLDSPAELIVKGETRNLSLSFDITEYNLTPGVMYCVIPYYYVDDMIQMASPKGFIVGDHSGIAGVEVDSDEPVRYYDLQGMPVNADDLRHGRIYIRRQGSKAVKIMY